MYAFIFVRSKDLKDSQSWSILVTMCASEWVCVSWIFIVREHFAIHFHLNCPFAFGTLNFTYWYLVCSCFGILYFFLFLTRSPWIFLKWSRRWQRLFKVLIYAVCSIFSSGLHRSCLTIWIVNVKPHTVTSLHHHKPFTFVVYCTVLANTYRMRDCDWARPNDFRFSLSASVFFFYYNFFVLWLPFI